MELEKGCCQIVRVLAFLQIIRCFEPEVSHSLKSKEELIDCSNELNLTLKQGKMIMLSGIYETDSRKLNICFLIIELLVIQITINYQEAGLGIFVPTIH